MKGIIKGMSPATMKNIALRILNKSKVIRDT
jgi:hypothetical protein